MVFKSIILHALRRIVLYSIFIGHRQYGGKMYDSMLEVAVSNPGLVMYLFFSVLKSPFVHVSQILEKVYIFLWCQFHF